MLKIALNKAGKRYNRDWIFRNIDYTLFQGHRYAVLGANGSGKSTFLQVLAGNYTTSEGQVDYTFKDKPVLPEDIYSMVSIAAPYLELPEDLTFQEILVFHSHFKRFVNGFSLKNIIEISELEKNKDKQIRYFSSGMKQRLKLTLAILSDTPMLLLDEPVTNLDAESIKWYRSLIELYTENRLVVVCSNKQDVEYDFCKAILNIEDYKEKSLI